MTLNSVSYGAVELKRYAQLYWLTGLGIAIALHFSLIASFYAFGINDAVRVFTVPPTVFHPGYVPPPAPPPLPGIVESPHVAAPPHKGDAARPVPVPEGQVSSDKTMATQDELRALVAPPDVSSVEGTGEWPIVIPPPEEEAPPDFVDAQELPHVVKHVVPLYPDLALRAGLTGRVFVKIWVDKEGRARKAMVTSEGNEVFHQAALDAAMQFVFTPAIMNGNPVSVWVTVPFSFTLKQ